MGLVPGKEILMNLNLFNGRGARLAVTAGLGLAMSLGSALGTVTTAFADTTPGNITITATEENEGVTYDAHKIFVGDVTSDNKMENIAWKDAATHTAVVAAIVATDSTYVDPTDAGESAQKAAEFIAAHILNAAGNGPNQDATLIVESASFADELAHAVSALPVDGTVTPGEATSFADGYYLFVTTASTIDIDQEGTAPIFAVVGGDDVAVTEKVTVPTLTKDVKEDNGEHEAVAEGYQADPDGTYFRWEKSGEVDLYAESDTEAPADGYTLADDENMYVHIEAVPASDGWGKAADANRSQKLAFRLTGTLPSNYKTFDDYHYMFTDNLPAGMTADLDSVVVLLHKDAADTAGTDITDSVDEISFESQVLLVDIEDLKLVTAGSGATAFKATADSWVTVEYDAWLNEDAVIGAGGNENVAFLTYRKDPYVTGDGTTTPDKTKTYTYQLNLHKQDKQNASRPLAGAKFTIQVVENEDAASVGKYVQADGSLGNDAYEFTTDSSGNFSVAGLDQGAYKIHETQAPPVENGAYDLVDDTVVTIDSNVEDMAAQQTSAQTLSLAASKEGDADVVVADSVNASGQSVGTGVNATAGTVQTIVRDTKQTQMPLTGAAGTTLLVTLAAVAGGVGLKLAFSKDEEE